MESFELKPEENNGNLMLLNTKSKYGLLIPKASRILIESPDEKIIKKIEILSE